MKSIFIIYFNDLRNDLIVLDVQLVYSKSNNFVSFSDSKLFNLKRITERYIKNANQGNLFSLKIYSEITIIKPISDLPENKRETKLSDFINRQRALQEETVPEWEQCGGLNYQGPTNCAEGLVCYVLTDYYFQCIRPDNKDCYRFPSELVSPSKDWRQTGGVSPVKNQQTCNACWAFSVVAALESMYLIHYNKSVIFSEQNLVDCSNIGDCVSGFPDVGIWYTMMTGLSTEDSYNYTWSNKKLECPRPWTNNWNFTDHGLHAYKNITNDEELMKAVIDKLGPIIVSLNYDGLIGYVPNTIIDIPDCSQVINHNALAVGYGTDPDTGIDYWIVKNSWGTSWGDRGFFKIARNKNMCGIGREAYYLCPDKICNKTNVISIFSGVNKPNDFPTANLHCQCGGSQFIGTSKCSKNLTCFQKTSDYSECSSQKICPNYWFCNNGTNPGGTVQLNEKCDNEQSCAKGKCYRQNKWYAQCLEKCPPGWWCNDKSQPDNKLDLWKLEGAEIYFKRIDDIKWVLIFNNEIASNFRFIDTIDGQDDTVVLQCTDIEPYLSKYIYLSSSGFGLANDSMLTQPNMGTDSEVSFNFYSSSGSWQTVFYESDGQVSMWLANQLTSSNLTANNDPVLKELIIYDQEDNIGGYYISLEKKLDNKTWIRYNEGSNFVFQILNKSDDEVILFTQGKWFNRYYKMNSTTLTIGDFYKNYTLLPVIPQNSEFNNINWVLSYSGTWIKICPGFFLYGPPIPLNTTLSTSTKKITTTTSNPKPITSTTKQTTTTTIIQTTKSTTKQITTTTIMQATTSTTSTTKAASG